MKSVIITGANGFVGSNTVNYFTRKGIRVLAVDVNEKCNESIIHNNVIYIQADLTNLTRFKEKIPKDKYDTFLHFAWSGSSGKSRINFDLQMQNTLMTLGCLKIAKEKGCTRFVNAGSIMEKEVVFSLDEQGEDQGISNNVYGMAKLMAHYMCKYEAIKIGIDLLWPYITNTYGVGELSPRFVNSTIRKIMNEEKLIFTSATQFYDFIYIDDVARAFYLIAKNGKPFHNYVIGSSNAKPLKEFIYEMYKELNANSVLEFGKISSRGINLPLSTFDSKSTEIDTGFKSQISFAEGTRRTRDWIVKNQ